MPSVYTVSREQFEQRMRVRRAATCVAVARSAVASGRLVEAIDRLEEACSLDPEAAEARLLLEELRSLEPQDRAWSEVRGHTEMTGWSHWVAAAIAICALAALAFFWPTAPSGTDGYVEPAREIPVAPSDESLPAATGSSPAPGLAVHDLHTDDLPSATGTVGAGTTIDAPTPPTGNADSVAIKVTREPVIQGPLPIVPMSGQASNAAGNATDSPRVAAEVVKGTEEAAREVPTTAPVAAGQASTLGGARPWPAFQGVNAAPTGAPAGGAGAVQASMAPASRPTVLPPLERVPVVDEAPAKPVAPDTEAANAAAPATVPAIRTADVPTEASLRMTGGAVQAIEGTLRRYADAYARLDAEAARAVWPTVDQRALARAFEGLQSQGIVFERCDVAVAGDEATAACNGRARYVPKVGSREPLVERRRWNFRLHKSDDGWQIAHAEAK